MINILQIDILCYCRWVSNCQEEEQDATTEEQSENASEETEDGTDEQIIVTPPDNLIAQELAEGPQELTQSNAVSSIKEAVKAV